jgi:hypothetical protein
VARRKKLLAVIKMKKCNIYISLLLLLFSTNSNGWENKKIKLAKSILVCDFEGKNRGEKTTLKPIFLIKSNYLNNLIIKDILNDKCDPNRIRALVESGPFLILFDETENPFLIVETKIDGRLIEHKLVKNRRGFISPGGVIGDRLSERSFSCKSKIWNFIIDAYFFSTEN